MRELQILNLFKEIQIEGAQLTLQLRVLCGEFGEVISEGRQLRGRGNENFCAVGLCPLITPNDPDKKELLSWGPSHCGRSSISYKRYPNYGITEA